MNWTTEQQKAIDLAKRGASSKQDLEARWGLPVADAMWKEVAPVGNLLMVTITWPGDDDRGMESYGPFASADECSAWIDKCIEAEKAGWRLLDGTYYTTHGLHKPFDPAELWEHSGDAMKVRHGQG